MREVVVRAADAADGEVAQAALDAWAARRLATYEDAERGLCFGRLDFETLERPLYVGRRWVHDEGGDRLVVNWQAPAARPFYTATPIDPQGVTLRRRFRANGRTLLDIADETLDGSTLDGARVSDFLLEELERSRDERMRDIVATIQADQYRLITYPPDSPLVIQGGPGTGKTAVGLHRASWLLYTARERSCAEPRPRRRAEPDLHGVRLARPSRARGGRRRAACGLGARRRRRADRQRAARCRAAEGRRPDGRRDRPRGRDPPPRGARRAAAPPRRRVRPRPRPRPGAAPRRGTRGARHDGRRARALPDGSRPELLRRVRPPPRGRRDARRGAGRAGAPVERRAPARPRPRLARRRPGQARPGPVHDTGLPGRGGRGCPRRRRAAAPAASRCRMGRGGHRTARRGACARRRACARIRPRHRRRGPGPLADAAAR